MDPLLEHRRRNSAALLSLAGAALASVLGLWNWLELRSLVLSLLAYNRVDPFSWKGIDNMTFLLFGILWLAYVFYSQHFLRTRIMRRRGWTAAARLLAVQLWLLLLCRGLPMALGTAPAGGREVWLALTGLAALLLTGFAVPWRRGEPRALHLPKKGS
ncbi:hypothetical protein MJA45_17825 [Paenibacillus aurantius]|uniref:Uncharacterized protein n=1 Tax=Paenibacillus aurantius TaxID=2918900 RepID=A0AA96LA39_9BACL|nr:hypothetical protein [Paenibacillus aurantius]WNQ09483.1 hypothetical protein MJA45_17825 [Paenibacillus aurantius]